MKNLYLLILSVTVLLFSCGKEENEITTKTTEISFEFDQELLQKVLVVPADDKEFRYFQKIIEKYSYTSSSLENKGVEYRGKRRNYLSVLLLSPGSHVEGKFGIIQLKGHDSDMQNCLEKVRNNIVPGKSVVILGGCQSTSSKTRVELETMGVRCISVNGTGKGPENDYLVLQLHADLQDSDSFEDAIKKIKEKAPETFGNYTFSFLKE